MQKVHLVDKEDIKDVSEVKRALEWCALIPGVEERIRQNPNEVLKELGLNLVAEDISFCPRENDKDLHMKALHPGTKAEKYANFVNNKFDYIDIIREACIPTNEAMKKWRDRQINRCKVDIGGHTAMLIHAPLLIEIADGCSIGCEFCGLNAGRLKSVFRYTEENAKLFNEVISACKEVIGDAAGHGTMYFASEPMDNPDYELFNRDYVKTFGVIPQITTAASTRHIERLRKLVAELDEDCGTIHRFSITSEKMAREIFDAFTPEELIFVELLPQFEEAPSNNFVKVGRHADGDSDSDYADTISCLSGFKVNMCRKEIALSTPTWSTKEHPTGEIILEVRNFTDGDDFKKVLKEMISKHMMNIIKPNDEITMADGLTYTETEDGDIIFTNNKDVEVKLRTNGGDSKKLNLEIFNILSSGYNTKREVVAKLNEKIEGAALGSDLIFFAINRYWNMGLIKTKSGTI